MDEMTLWLTPLILLPGVALLIMSTSIRFNRLHDEVHDLLDAHHQASRLTQKHLLHRTRRFRNALVALYVCVSLFAVASLVGMLAALWYGETSAWLVLGIAALGIVCLTFAAIELIRESLLAAEIIEDHEQLFGKD